MKKSIQAPASVQTDNNLISLSTASEQFKVHRNTLLNWIRSGSLSVQTGKRNKYYLCESELISQLTARGYFVQGA